MKIKNILVPVDFSPCSKNALRTAISIAKKQDAKIHLVNAIHQHTHPEVIGGSLVSAIVNDYEGQIQASFKELKSELIELEEVHHEIKQFSAYLIDAIYTMCESRDIDLIVMGTRSEHDTLDHLLGTRAADIIGSASVPVLVIPEESQVFEPKKIGFASDFLRIDDTHKLDILKEFAQIYNAEIFVFHISEDPNKLSTEEQRAIDSIRNRLDGCINSVRTVEYSSIIDGIRDFAKVHELDLLTMIHRKHNLFERIFKKSITKNIAIDFKTPLLTVHEI